MLEIGKQWQERARDIVEAAAAPVVIVSDPLLNG